jgi:phosphoribosyl 1,2-cyclic phosphodiesterase
VELEAPGQEAVIFDGGTGIRALGRHLKARRIHLFLTHFHWDHIQGIPFFAPLYDPANHVTIYSSGFSAPLKASLAGLMAEPYFPVKFEAVGAKVELVDLGTSQTEAAGVRVCPFEANHPQGACGYRIESGGARVVYAPDREHGHARLDSVLLEAARGADVLVLDSQYTPEEYPLHKGWGHSTWQESARVAREAGVRRLVLFHYDPSHDDETLQAIEVESRKEFPQTYAAREGWSVEV